MNLGDIERPNSSYEGSPSWPHFRSLAFDDLADSEDEPIELEEEGPDLTWVGPVATTTLALAIGIAIGVWVVPIVRSPPKSLAVASAGPPSSGPVAAADASSPPRPSPALPIPRPSAHRQSAVGAAAAPSPRKVSPSRLIEALQGSGTKSHRTAQQQAPLRSPIAKLPRLSPADVEVAVMAPPPPAEKASQAFPPSGRSSTDPAAIAAPSPPKHEANRSTWLHKPTRREMAEVFEEYAGGQELSGSAILSCVVAASGSVRDCRVAAETPADAGLGLMALKLSRFFKIKQETMDGEALNGATVSIPIKFAGPTARH